MAGATAALERQRLRRIPGIGRQVSEQMPGGAVPWILAKTPPQPATCAGRLPRLETAASALEALGRIFHTHAPSAMSGSPRHAPPVITPAQRDAPVLSLNLWGHLSGGFGLGEGARCTARILRTAGVRVRLHDLPLATHVNDQPVVHATRNSTS